MIPGTPLITALGTRGDTREAGSNAPILLEEPDLVWAVVEGKVDVFAVRVHDGRAEGARDYLFSASAGDVLFGMEPEWADEVGLLAVGNAGTRVVRATLDTFKALGREHAAEACDMIDRYVLNFSGAVSRRSTPRFDLLLEPGAKYNVPEGADLGSRRGTAWVKLKNGPLFFDGYRALPIRPGDGPFPLAAGGWAYAAADIDLVVAGAAEVMHDGSLWAGLQSFQRVALEWADLILGRDRAASRAQLQARIGADRAASSAALSDLANVMVDESLPLAPSGSDHVFAACCIVGAALDLELRPAGVWEGPSGPLSAVDAIARASSVGHRRVVLGPGWWQRDQGPLLGFIAEEKDASSEGDLEEGRVADVFPHGLDGGRIDRDDEAWEDEQDDTRLVPVALIPTSPGGYELVNPRDNVRIPVDHAVSEGLGPFGVQFYRGLPARPVGLTDIWRFVRFGTGGDVRTIVALGGAGAVMSLIVPLFTAYLFDSVIPSSERLGLATVFVALAVSTLASAAFGITRAIALVRLRARIGVSLQMAILDRLVRLPLPFHRRYSTGDLGNRASGVNSIGHHLSGATVSAILSTMVSAGSYVLLWYYSMRMAILATGILVVNVVFAGVTARLALKYVREEQEVDGRLSALVLQLLGGISKLRVSGTEARAFSRWARVFRRRQEVSFRVGLFSNNLRVFNAVLSIASTLIIYWAYTVIARDPAWDITTGQFLAFIAAFGTFIAAGMELTRTGMGLLALIPTWERAKPIVEAVPEVDVSKPDPGELTGRIEVTHVSFRYREDGPPILSDVSIEAAPGEFIALVGPSGAGKSTLLRVLLGFDRPASGSVFIDGNDLATVDIAAVRRQIGVVLQSSVLTHGDIFSNIVGSSPRTLADAWEAARLAGMAEDIRALPMGMHTVISEGGGTFSGGQRQRLLVARALVNRPRILYFDEATSALDNRTQATMSESLEGLHATLLVIAHRLSTIRRADRIYVMEAGRVVQAGSFDELMSRKGLFADLAARQEV